MGYNKALFHRIAEELDRLGSEAINKDNTEEMDYYDIFLALDGLGKLIVTSSNDELASASVNLATCCFGGMYEVLEELPDAKKCLLELLLKDTKRDTGSRTQRLTASREGR